MIQHFRVRHIFFNNGISSASLRSAGMVAEDKDILMTKVIIGSKWSIHIFTNHVGIGSMALDLLDELIINLRTSVSVAGSKSSNVPNVPVNVSSLASLIADVVEV